MYEAADWYGANILVTGVDRTDSFWNRAAEGQAEVTETEEPEKWSTVPNRADRRKKGKRNGPKRSA